jgi:peroxiredoxin
MSDHTRESIAEIFARCTAMDASLPEQLSAFWRETADRGPAFAAEVETLVARLKAHDVGATSPRLGEPMPPFALPDTTGRLVDLDSLLANGPAVVVFHRGHWCPFCRMSSIALGRAQGRIGELGGQMVAILPDRQPYAGMLRDFSGCRFPFLIDADNGYAMMLNLVFWVGESMSRMIAGVGNDVPRYQGNDSWLLPIPATYVVGRDGIVRERFLDPDYRTRFTVEALIDAVARA